jgi:predicted  nucleic acid-binding Zn-ribbon protein
MDPEWFAMNADSIERPNRPDGDDTMAATAENLRDLHLLHQRAKALRDRMTSGPKTLAARQAALTNRQAALEASRKALQDSKVQLKKREHSLQAHQSKIDDLRVKLNLVKKNEEYKALQNQIANDKAAIEKLEGEMLEDMMRIDEQAAALAAEELEVKTYAGQVAAFRNEIESQASEQKSLLVELESSIIGAEAIIPEDLRERYRRTVKQHGADAMAFIENGACSGCFVSITAQMMNELINAHSLSFCKSCGRVLYLAEEDVHNTRRSAR